MESLRIASILMGAQENPRVNLQHAKKLVLSSLQDHPDLIVLPEMFLYVGSYGQLNKIAKEYTPKVLEEFCHIARENRTAIILGSLPESSGISDSRGRVFNTLYGIDEHGREFIKYRKIHLFNVEAIGKQIAYDEQEGFIAGDQLAKVCWKGLNLGVGVCFDLRFSQFFMEINKPTPLDLLILPAAFTKKTGESHWHTLVKARAIEWQHYMIAVNQVGEHAPGKASYGHSLVVDPWGRIESDSKEGKGWITNEIYISKLKDARLKINMSACVRSDFS